MPKMSTLLDKYKKAADATNTAHDRSSVAPATTNSILQAKGNVNIKFKRAVFSTRKKQKRII